MSTPEEVPEIPTHGGDQAVPVTDPGDYNARVRSDPEFAVSELSKAKSHGTKLANELKSMAPLKDIASRLEGGAATAAQLIYEQAAVLQHPEVRQVVEHYRKFGTLPTASVQRSDPSEDEYVDPIDSLRNEVTELKNQLSQVTGHVNRDRTVIAHTAMQSHMQSLHKKYEHLWDIIEPVLLEQAESWERTPSGREYLSGATLETWDNIAKIALGNNLDTVTQRHAERRVQGKRELGTEPSPQTVTSGREAPLAPAETWKPGMARKLIQEQWRREGRSV